MDLTHPSHGPGILIRLHAILGNEARMASRASASRTAVSVIQSKAGPPNSPGGFVMWELGSTIVTPPSVGVAKLSQMDSQTAREKLDRWYKALNTRQFKELRALLAEIADVEIVLEYPQSGERIKGIGNNLAVLENYPGLPD